MRFLRLRVAHYRGIESCEVQFTPRGITLVQGPNEIGKTSLGESIGILFEEAIWASRFYEGNISRHLDLGSGAGFPAIVLKIINPSVALELVESREKRAVFLETVLAELGYKDARVSNCRIEQFLHNCKMGSWDCISWKGIRLSGESFRLLSTVCNANSQLWMFHGNKLAAEIPEDVTKFFDLQQREQFPGKKSWFLSVFHVKL